MRHYGYAEWLETVSRVTGIDLETLRVSHVDAAAAILALGAAGGCRISDDEITDVVAGCYRLLVHLLQLRPYRGNGHDRVAHASVVEYARRRGCSLDLGPQAIHLLEEFQTERLTPGDVRHALRKAIRLERRVGRFVKAPAFLTGLRVALATAVSEPSEEYRGPAQELRVRIEGWATRHGARFAAPVPTDRVTAGVGVYRLEQAGGRERLPPVSTSDILRRSIARVTGADLIVILNDPRSTGIHVEREWALRLGIPIIELALSPVPHPHQDGPDLATVIDVEPGRLDQTLRRLQDEVCRQLFRIEDAHAMSEAFALKNETALAHLRGSWGSLESDEKRGVSDTLRMSQPYIEGLLSNSMALELASDRQRGGLERMLGVHNPKHLAQPGQLDDSELVRLTAAGERAGLDGLTLVRAVRVAESLWRRSRMRAQLASDADADRCVAEAVAVVERSW